MDNSARHLARAVKAATTAMTPMRNNRHMFLKQYAGPYFAVRQAKEASATATPLNMIHSLVSVVLPHLVSGCPKAMIVARRPELKEAAEIFSLAWDRMAVDIDLGSTMRTIVTDAMFGAGIIKVGLCQSEENAAAAQEPEGYLHDNGRPFADAIDLDDYIIDPDARDRQAAAFEGNQYRLPLQYVLESGLYDRRAAGRLAPVNSPKDGAIEPMVELIDLWLPRENAVCASGGSSTKAAASAPQTGQGSGGASPGKTCPQTVHFHRFSIRAIAIHRPRGGRRTLLPFTVRRRHAPSKRSR